MRASAPSSSAWSSLQSGNFPCLTVCFFCLETCSLNLWVRKISSSKFESSPCISGIGLRVGALLLLLLFLILLFISSSFLCTTLAVDSVSVISFVNRDVICLVVFTRSWCIAVGGQVGSWQVGVSLLALSPSATSLS